MDLERSHQPVEGIKIISIPDDLETLGGAGSGNFGHAGRPGEVGGSAEGGSGASFFQRAGLAKFSHVPVVRHDTPNGTKEAEVKGDKIHLYPNFDKLTPEQQDFVFTHEVGHWVLDQHGLSKLVKDAEDHGINVWNPDDLAFQQSNMHEAFADAFSSFHSVNEKDRDVLTRYPKWAKLIDYVTKSVQQRNLGGAGSGNFGHAGRPGEVGGSAAADDRQPPTDGSLRGVEASMRRALPTTHDRTKTRFILTDGTALGFRRSGDYHMEAADEAGSTLDEILSLGIVRRASTNDVEIGAPITEAQARVIVEDAYEDHPLYVSLRDANDEGPAKMFERRTADGVRNWVNQYFVRKKDPRYVAAGGRGSGNFGHAGRPGEVGGSAPYAGTMAEHFAEPTKDHSSALKLPPAWTHVRVNTDPDAALVAVGKDKKGRTQYRYSAAHSEAAAAEKFERMKSFEKALPTLRSATEQDVDHENEATREAAVVTRLIDKTGFRIGSDEDTLASKKAYGATTLQARHVMVSGDTVTFAFSGKKGVPIRKTIEDPVLARVIGERLQNLKSRDPLFKTSDKAVRDYMAQHAPGHTPKDFRTRHATAMALDLVKRQPKPANAREAKYARLEIAKKVSEFLGNTPTVALASYINPVVFAKWKAA